MGRELRMTNGEVRDAPSVCHGCQTPSDSLRQHDDGEWYCGDCESGVV